MERRKFDGEASLKPAISAPSMKKYITPIKLFKSTSVDCVGKREQLLELAREFYEEVQFTLEQLKSLTPLELLVRTVISQNTNERNAERAMANVKDLIFANDMIKADLSKLEEALKIAGLYRVKAKRIKQMIEVLNSWNVKLEEVLSASFEEARSKLMELPGVGYKTADVLLAFKAGAPVIPIDTHIERIAKRLGLVEKRAKYEEIRMALESFVPPEERALFHLALIAFGRKKCKARRPACTECRLKDYCEHYKLEVLPSI